MLVSQAYTDHKAKNLLRLRWIGRPCLSGESGFLRLDRKRLYMWALAMPEQQRKKKVAREQRT